MWIILRGDSQLTENELKLMISNSIYEYYSSINMYNHFSKDDYTGLLLSLLDLNRKWIPQQKRKVFYSKEIKDKIENKKIKQKCIDLIYEFESKFLCGENINSHLSKNIYLPSNLDKLLLYWNIHHLHLSNKNAENYEQMHSNRSDYYLLFLIDKFNVYFLDITKHLKGSEFSSLKFLEIVFNNGWESVVPFVELPNITGVSFEINNKEQQNQFWNTNVNYFIHNYNGKYYGNINGVMLSGNSIEDMKCVCELNKVLFDISKQSNVILKSIEVMSDNCILKIEISVDNDDEVIEVHNDIQQNIFKI